MSTQRRKSSGPTVPSHETRVAPLGKSTQSVVPLVAVVISGFALSGAIFLWLVKNAGHAYREGYLTRFGFQPDALPWSADDLTVLGYYAQADILIVFLALVMAGALLFGGVFYASNWVLERKANRKGGNTSEPNLATKPRLVTAEVTAAWVAAVVLLALLFCCVVPLGLLAPVHARGVKDADTVMHAIRNLDTATLRHHNMNFVEITRDRVGTASGVVISCTEKFCALYSPVGPIHAHTVPLSDITSWSTIDWDKIPENEWKEHS